MNSKIPIKIKLFLENYNIKIKKFKKVRKGISNKVYFIKTIDNKKYIIKDYTNSYNKTCKEKLINNCKNKGINTLNIVYKYNNNCDIEMYKYINHIKCYKLNNKSIKYLVYIVNELDIPLNENFSFQDTIFYKINQYILKLEKLKEYKLNKSIIHDILNKYKSLNLSNIRNMYIIHGDISSTNILWQKKNLAIVDFDEAIVAPREYEYISMLIKFCFNSGKFNKKLAKLFLLNLLKNCNLDQLQKMMYFYILKVLIEKIYLYEYGIIDLYDKRQRTDSWMYWYKLLYNKNLIIKNLI